jgi:hypothetical protein
MNHPNRRFSFPLLLTGWIIATMGIAIIAVGLCDSVIRDEQSGIQLEAEAGIQLESIGPVGRVFTIGGLALLVVAVVFVAGAFWALGTSVRNPSSQKSHSRRTAEPDPVQREAD